MRHYSYLQSAKQIIQQYRGEIPLAAFLKKYFSANKKYGSRDRKQVAALCYHFFRLGKSMPQLPVEEKIIAAAFLCDQKQTEFLQFHKPEWNQLASTPLDEKLALVGITGQEIFPWIEELSEGIDAGQFIDSFFTQPDFFLRIRPGKKEKVMEKLRQAGLPYTLQSDTCIVLPNSTKIDTVLEADTEAVVQDRSSQQVLNFLVHNLGQIKNPPVVWDCCAASGGKSILTYDLLNGELQLTVSDVRQRILENLRNRFQAAGINNYHTLITDLAATDPVLPGNDFDLIICDAPCSGSGTWSRTPEQLHYFDRKRIDEYAALQQQIVSRVIPQLKNEGTFIYITCSVFKKENEAMASFISNNFQLRVLQQELLKGYEHKADSMFVAVFSK